MPDYCYRCGKYRPLVALLSLCDECLETWFDQPTVQRLRAPDLAARLAASEDPRTQTRNQGAS